MPNLHDYFSITVSSKDKKCFIYDPDNTAAFFIYSPEPNDIFITKRLEISLFYRPSFDNTPWNSIIQPEQNIPLLKSNLQKAIRRKQTDIAIATFIVLLKLSPIDVLRRLPVIFIEDVCLMTSFPIVVWLMMCDNEYTIKKVDVFILVNIIKSLCETDEVFMDNKEIKEYNGGHKELFKICDDSSKDAILALYYRSKYGGLKGDMEMLRRAINYYLECGNIVETKWNHTISFSHKVTIIPESIDFHPYPNLLWDINRITRIHKDIIKKSIWNAESCINVRKPETQLCSDNEKKLPIWKIIKVVLDDWRSKNI